jgi:hypothetical protein
LGIEETRIISQTGVIEENEALTSPVLTLSSSSLRIRWPLPLDVEGGYVFF